MRNSSEFHLITVCIALIFLCGCAGGEKKVAREIEKIYKIPFVDVPVDCKVADNFTQNAPKVVAVLPFKYAKKPGDNFYIGRAVSREVEPSTEQVGCEILRKVFYKFFSTLSYTDMDPAYVDAVLVDSGIKNVRQLYDTPYYKLGELLKADAVIMGEIERVSNFTGGVYSHTILSGKLNMYSTKTGQSLWSVNHYESEKGGVIYKSSQVMDLIESQIQNAKKEMSFIKVAEEFSRKVVDSIPDEGQKTVGSSRMPLINMVYIEEKNLATKTLLPGDKISISMQGSPGMKAAFDIGTWKTNIPMEEISPGNYRGCYWINYGDEAERQIIAAKLKNRFGMESIKFSDPVFSCKAKLLPDTVSLNAEFKSETQLVKLKWGFIAKEISHYTVYRSKNRDPEFKQVLVTKTPYFEDKIIDPDAKTYTYQIIAYDFSGNSSKPAGPVEVVVK